MAGAEGRERLVRDVLQILLASRDEDLREEIVDVFNALGKARQKAHSVNTADRLERCLGQCPEVFQLDKEYKEVFVRPRTKMSICPTHFKKHGSCRARNCSDLHFCAFYLLSGYCSLGDGRDCCGFGHSLRTPHNGRALGWHLLGGLDITDLRSLLCLPWVRRGITLPRVCWYFNQHCGCGRKNECRALHLCLPYVLGTCRFGKGCRRNHNINHPQVTQALTKYGVNVSGRRLTDILEEVKMYESDSNTSTSRDNDDSVDGDEEERRTGFQFGAKPKMFGSVPNLFQGRDLQPVPQNNGRRPRCPSAGRRGKEGSYTALSREAGRSPRMESLCVFHLMNKCRFGDSCHHLHSDRLYLWRLTEWPEDVGRDEDVVWSSLDHDNNLVLEREYSKPNVVECTLQDVNGDTMKVNLREFTAVSLSSNQRYKIRRLTTPSSAESNKSQLPIATVWLWYWRNQDGDWIEIGLEGAAETGLAELTSARVERNYLTSANTPLKSGRFVLDFGKMRLKDLHLGRKFKVRRRPQVLLDDSDAESDDGSLTDDSETEGQTADDYDDVTNDDDDVETQPDDAAAPTVSVDDFLTTLTPETVAYTKVKSPFCGTLGRAATVLSIQRVDNTRLTAAYASKKKSMPRKSGRLEERILYYGVEPDDDVITICQSGMDCSNQRDSKHNTSFGKGGYFYATAAQADKRTGHKKERKMFVVSCLTGRFVRGSPKLTQPPCVDGSKGNSERYDSCVDDTAYPRLFVIFDNAQVFPKYLVTYTLK
ncbi:protein mono-ADP-ribosyltransferase PARP12-like [Littorina saxatilis]|uniref:Uncharacterized protein n=1 Tax=Littorina saxatilis TaxID=31220 RepID=A0AAN9GIN2_9CAEN